MKFTFQRAGRHEGPLRQDPRAPFLCKAYAIASIASVVVPMVQCPRSLSKSLVLAICMLFVIFGCEARAGGGRDVLVPLLVPSWFFPYSSSRFP